MKWRAAILFCCLFSAGHAWGDTVEMRDGTTRQGTVESYNDKELRLRSDAGGISTTVVIPMSQVARVLLGAPGASPPGPSSAPAATQPRASATPSSTLPPPTDTEREAFRSRGFLGELAAATFGHGGTDLARLPAPVRAAWEKALAADQAGQRAQTLDALRQIEAAMRDLPGGLERLDAIARQRPLASGQPADGLGEWMARLHWDLIETRYQSGQYDLKDVREIERIPLVRIMREKSLPALDVLRPYLPPIDEKTGRSVGFRPAQLAGITTGNALEVKDAALHAEALLMGQIKLQPELPPADRAFLGTQWANVNRILSKAASLEGQARAAIAKAQQQQRIADAQARRDAAVAAQKAAVKGK